MFGSQAAAAMLLDDLGTNDTAVRAALHDSCFCRTPYPGGAPANVAAALGKLGVKVAFISALGQDDLAVQMLDLLSGNQIPKQAKQ